MTQIYQPNRRRCTFKY